MMATPHILTGAAIGRATGRAWLAYPAAFGSHFLLDWAPHLDSHAMYGLPEGGPTLPEAGIAVTDFVLGAALLIWLVHRDSDRRLVLTAGLMAIIIDLFELIPPIGPLFKSWPGTAWLSAWHHGIQDNVTPDQWPLGVGTQVAVIALSLAVILHLKRKRGLTAKPLCGS